jgi:STE24 endopeptidase
LITLLHMAVSLPLVYYSGYVLEHRFRLSNMTLGGWIKRYAKQNALALAFGTFLIVGLYWLIWTTGHWWWLTAAGAFFCVTIVLGRIVPLLIIPLFYKVERLDSPELGQRMKDLAAGTGLTIEGVYRIVLSQETVKANAALTGIGRSRRVLLGDTLLNHFSTDEITVVFAHEVGHHVFRHVQKMILLGLLLSVSGFWICDRVLMGGAAAAGHPLEYAAMPVWTQPWLLLILTVFGMLLEPAMNAISRRHERQCDRYALERTRLPAAYVSAFSKLAQQNKDDPNPHWLEVLWLHDHPPIAERLAMAGER